MPPARCTLEIHVAHRWVTAAELRVEDVGRGYGGPARFEYDLDYLTAEAVGATDLRAVSCRYPVSYEPRDEPAWPAFVLDLMPSGASRRAWERLLHLPNTPASDWPMLVHGAGNPPGNVRVAEAAPPPAPDALAHAGFRREDVLERAADFIEYARQHGASIAGGSGAGGDAPKFLLREDIHGRWHADGAISDAVTFASWIVKFPRSTREADRLVLEAEASYYRVASRFGLRTGPPPTWEQDCLFIRRFDRVGEPGEPLTRLGFESLCSLAGASEFGVAMRKERLAAALARAVTEPVSELRELLARDLLDVALGNTDNHARNTAVLKHPDGRVELSPLYDFAPMVLDPQGIARVCRWEHETHGALDFARAVDALEPLGLDARETKRWLASKVDAVSALPQVLLDEGTPARVVDVVRTSVGRVVRGLEKIT